ncbi:MAG: hypothetical protein K0Q55_2205 [Verrucomicrobia bacterium]|nr:hypothetical protein [Verrucomicrobiota bacterium]
MKVGNDIGGEVKGSNKSRGTPHPGPLPSEGRGGWMIADVFAICGDLVGLILKDRQFRLVTSAAT